MVNNWKSYTALYFTKHFYLNISFHLFCHSVRFFLLQPKQILSIWRLMYLPQFFLSSIFSAVVLVHESMISHPDYNSLHVTLPAHGFITFHFTFHSSTLIVDKLSNIKISKNPSMTTKIFSSLSCIPSSDCRHVFLHSSYNE